MANIPSTQLNKSTSFHSIALSLSYIGVLIFFHFVTPYIHELVYSFFSGLFLILSIILFFYFNALLRTSSITHLSYRLLIFRIIYLSVFLSLSMIAIAFMTNTTEIIKRDEFILFYLNLCFFNLSIMILAKKLYKFIKPSSIPNIIVLTNLEDVESLEINNFFTGKRLI